MTIPLVLGVLAVVFFLVGYTSKKKDDKRLLYILAVLALAGFAISGGYISFAAAPSAAPGGGAGTPAGVWKATISTITDAGTNVATIIVAPDGTHADLYFNHATYGNPNPTELNVTVNVFNQNTNTQNTQPYQATLTYGQIGIVQKISTGQSYPLVSLLTDGKTYNVVWSAVSSAPTPVSQGLGVYTASFTSLQNGQEKAVLTYNTAAFGAMTVGQQYEIDLSVAGITLPIYFHPTS